MKKLGEIMMWVGIPMEFFTPLDEINDVLHLRGPLIMFS